MPGPAVVLVHGAFADASGFAGVIRELESAGHTALAPPNPLRGVAFDASVVSDVVKAIDGPVVLVGHSYGGAVIGQASAGLENVTGLVFLAAFGLEVGESCASVQQPFPPPLLAKTAAPTPYDAPGAAGGPDLYVQKDGFRETFCADVPARAVARSHPAPERLRPSAAPRQFRGRNRWSPAGHPPRRAPSRMDEQQAIVSAGARSHGTE
jgi:pimeloyl-ACP methyl ester carboxylesterase